MYPVKSQALQPTEEKYNFSPGTPISCAMARDNFDSSLQYMQSFLASLCANTPKSVDEIRKFSIPISMRRLREEVESLVCSVESTRWPVSAERRAMSAVSESRISPTMIMSGSCLKMERKPAAKVSPTLVFTCI